MRQVRFESCEGDSSRSPMSTVGWLKMRPATAGQFFMPRWPLPSLATMLAHGNCLIGSSTGTQTRTTGLKRIALNSLPSLPLPRIFKRQFCRESNDLGLRFVSRRTLIVLTPRLPQLCDYRSDQTLLAAAAFKARTT